MFEHKNKHYVRGNQGEPLKPSKAALALRNGGGSIILWDCFSVKGICALYSVDGKINEDLGSH